MHKINKNSIRKHFNSEIDKYIKDTFEIGLWKSEEYIFKKYFGKNDRILDIGCGTGRTTFGLYEKGYKNITGVDLTPNMINAAQKIAQEKEAIIDFIVGDATNLKFKDGSFDQALFSFNGLMQIPGQSNRITAMNEIKRVLKPGGYFIFTTHDRNNNDKFAEFWKKEKKRWKQGKQDRRLYEYGDRIIKPMQGSSEVFIHIPDRVEIFDCIEEAGFLYIEDFYRNDKFQEIDKVKQNTNECCFWVTRKSE